MKESKAFCRDFVKGNASALALKSSFG